MSWFYLDPVVYCTGATIAEFLTSTSPISLTSLSIPMRPNRRTGWSSASCHWLHWQFS